LRGVENSKELALLENLKLSVLPEPEQILVAGHEEGREAFLGGGDVLVVIRVGRDDSVPDLSFHENGRELQEGDLLIELFPGKCQPPPDLRIIEAVAQLSEDALRCHECESSVIEKAPEDANGRPLRLDEGADEDVGVEDRAKHDWLRAPLAA
jgi:hypothetical protein